MKDSNQFQLYLNQLEMKHESIDKHVTGTALYIDDLPEVEGTLHAYIGTSSCAKGKIISINLDAVKTAEGVLGVITASDIPGINDISPTGLNDEPVLADNEIAFWGQPIFVVIAKTRDQARAAARQGKVAYKSEKPDITIVDAEKSGAKLVTKGLILERGDVDLALLSAPNRLKGEITIGGQDHFYLEGHIALSIPGEDEDVLVLSSTQHPSEVQHMVAKVLGINSNAVTVQVRRMGGAFGGKETQSNLFAVIAALASKKYGKAVKIRPDRDDDMIITGKRHDFIASYEVGYDNEGHIQAVDAVLSARCGFSADLSGPVTDRALFHSDNCYFYQNVRLKSRPLRTNTVSNTAFRGFGGPQGIMLAERMIQEVAYALGKDTLEVRKVNLYDKGKRSITPYHQKIRDNIAPKIISELTQSAHYYERRANILKYNSENQYSKKGIALTPVKFGISFTATWFNQAGALVHIYTDGTIALNHGGTEMGQGLNTKVIQIVALEIGVSVDKIKITATNTSKVPNTSATAASSGTDLNGMAALNAVQKIIRRLKTFGAKVHKVKYEDIYFRDDQVYLGHKKISFPKFIGDAYLARIKLWDSGFYKTPKIHWNRELGKGSPFYYFSYGAAISETTLDTLTGEYVFDRVDILHDVGESINSTIDIGQVEGGFIQGLGWLTTEELWWDEEGQLKTHAPSSYKIPLASDRPKVFNISLASWSKNKERTVRRSKAVGEPPLMLAVSAHEALVMAVAATSEYQGFPNLDSPATPERVLAQVESLREKLVTK